MAHPRCPICGSKKVAEFIYGYPEDDERLKFDENGALLTDLSEEREDDIIYMGGEKLPAYRPAYHCKSCGTEYGKHMENPDEPPYHIIGMYFSHGGYFGGVKQLDFKLT